MIFGTPCAAWGEAPASPDAYAKLAAGDSDALQKFLKSLILFPPDDTE